MKSKDIINKVSKTPNDTIAELKNKSDIGHKHPMSDIEGLSLEANAVNYDNSASGLTSNKVQGVIDEINTKVIDNETSILSLNIKVDNGQNFKITNDDGTCKNASRADLNSLFDTGNYVGDNFVNAPNTYHSIVEVVKATSNVIRQIFTETTSTKQYLRVYKNNTWTTWREL